MLKLTRKPGESITLFTTDGEIVVKIDEVRAGRQVGISIDAPDNVDIARTELTEEDAQ